MKCSVWTSLWAFGPLSGLNRTLPVYSALGTKQSWVPLDCFKRPETASTNKNSLHLCIKIHILLSTFIWRKFNGVN